MLLYLGELSAAAGIAGLLLPSLISKLGLLADLLFLALVVVALSLAMPLLGSAFRSALTRGTPEILGIGSLFLSIQCISIAVGIAIARGGLNSAVAVSAAALGVGLIAAYVVVSRRSAP
jgi:hypothetical protein